jgi:hypothetical protein
VEGGEWVGRGARGEKTSVAKEGGGERGNIGQTKISSKGEEEREQLMGPEEAVMFLRNTNRRLPAPTNQGPSALGTNVKFLPSCFFETQMYRMENGTLRMGILKTKGLRPLVKTVFHSQQKCPYAPFRFPKLGFGKRPQNKTTVVVGTKNLIKHSYRQTDRRTDGRINEVRALPLESGRE